MIKTEGLKFSKEELNILLSSIDKEEHSDLFKKIKNEYDFMCHQEKAFNIIKEYYGHNFIDAIYYYQASDYKEGLFKYKVHYTAINQETYKKETICDVEVVKIIKEDEDYNYELIFHK